ncbi:MAG: class I SAM-dependent methyltransferase [Nitrospirae bacterium]|nr:class I SAM-dependent methyltransferase [Nitrospirota bacterium]
MTADTLANENTAAWRGLLAKGGPRNNFPHSYVVGWYFRHVKPELSGGSVLDIGCATAPDLWLFASEGFAYSGIDVTDACFDEAIRMAGKRGIGSESYSFGLFDPPNLPFPDNSMNIVIGLESLHFNAGRQAMDTMLWEVFRVLAPRGHFLFTTINHRHFFTNPAHSRMIGDNCLMLTDSFPDPGRAGMKYHLFQNKQEILDRFEPFAETHVGEYFLDTCDGRPDGYHVIFGKKRP